MIKLTNVTQTHQHKNTIFTSVDNVSLHIREGEVVGIVGKSGAGKSTLLRLLNGLSKPNSGELIVQGLNLKTANVSTLNKLRFNIGTIFQNYNLLSSLTVFENVALRLRIVKYPQKAINKRVDEVLKLVNLSAKANNYPATLSGGEKQRVAIARAISNHPALLLCDEITSALDQNTTNEIISLLQTIKDTEKLTIVFVSHQLEVVSRLCSRVIVMDKGKVVEDAPTANIFLNPQANATKALVDTVLDYSRFDIPLNYLLVYNEATLNEPILSQTIKSYDIEPSILYAKSLEISAELYGFMIMRFNTQLRMDVINHLQNKGIYIKKLGGEDEYSR